MILFCLADQYEVSAQENIEIITQESIQSVGKKGNCIFIGDGIEDGTPSLILH